MSLQIRFGFNESLTRDFIGTDFVAQKGTMPAPSTGQFERRTTTTNDSDLQIGLSFAIGIISKRVVKIE